MRVPSSPGQALESRTGRVVYTPEQVINTFREAETMLAGGQTVAQIIKDVSLRI